MKRDKSPVLLSHTPTSKVSKSVIHTTYLIDEQGIISCAYGKVKAADNPAQMLEALA